MIYIFGRVITLFQKFFLTSSRQFQRLEAVSRSPIYSILQDIMQGLTSIRLYGKQLDFFNRSAALIDQNGSARIVLQTSLQ